MLLWDASFEGRSWAAWMILETGLRGRKSWQRWKGHLRTHCWNSIPRSGREGLVSDHVSEQVSGRPKSAVSWLRSEKTGRPGETTQNSLPPSGPFDSEKA